jgi:hypothetical protein
MGFLEDMQKTFFFQSTGAGAPQGASAADMRRKIALAMLMKKTPFPKTFGEGLSAIGEAIGDRSLAARTELEVAQQAAATDAEIAKIPGVTPSATTGPRAEADIPAVGQLADAVDSPAPAATAAAPLPAAVRTAAAPPPPGGIPPNVASWHGFATRPFEQGGLGVQPHQAAGIVGNLQNESTPKILPTGVVGDKGTAFGAAQWRNDRYANLQGFARANGMDPMTTEAQQAFMRHEMRGSGPYGGGSEARAFNALSGAPDPRSAATAFDRTYERSDGSTIAKRVAAAENLARVMSNPNSTPRDRIAAQAALNADTPPTASDVAQEATLGDVTGMRRAPPSFGATASLGGRTGDVQSDMPPITGALQGPLGQAVGDTVQARQDTLAPPQAVPPTPPPPGPQVAQASPFPNPVVAADGRVAPIIPGGGLPPPIAPQISQAPPDPRAAIRAIPATEEYKPRNRPQPEPPAAPGMGPIEADLTQRILNRDVDPRLKAAAAARIEQERAQRAIPYNNKMKKYDADIKDWAEEQKQDREYQQKQEHTVLTNEKLRRDMEGEGYTPLTPQEAQKMLPMGGQLPAGQTVWLNRKGEPKFGPTPGTTVNVDTKGATEESKVRGKLAAEREGEVLAAGNKSGEELTTIARAEALLDKIQTGALEPGRTTIAALGKSIGVSDDFMKSIGLRPEEVGSRQAFQSIVNELTMGKIGPGGMPSNNFSEGDRKFLEKTEIGLGDDPESNRIKLASARKKRELHVEKADRWGDYKEENPNKSFSDFERVWNKELKARNEFGELQTRAEQLIANAKGGAAQKGIPGDLPTSTTKIGETVSDGNSKFLRTPEGWTRVK